MPPRWARNSAAVGRARRTSRGIIVGDGDDMAAAAMYYSSANSVALSFCCNEDLWNKIF